MPWSTFIASTSPAATLKPGNYGAVTTKSVVATVGGTELIAADAAKKLRFANISVESKLKANGNPITVFVGVGVVPTPDSYSYKWLAGFEAQDFEVNGQAITALSETGETIKIQVQLADPVLVS